MQNVPKWHETEVNHTYARFLEEGFYLNFYRYICICNVNNIHIHAHMPIAFALQYQTSNIIPGRFQEKTFFSPVQISKWSHGTEKVKKLTARRRGLVVRDLSSLTVEAFIYLPTYILYFVKKALDSELCGLRTNNFHYRTYFRTKALPECSLISYFSSNMK